MNDILGVLRSIGKFDKRINPDVFLEKRMIKLNGEILNENVKCEIGDMIHIAKDQYRLDWDFYQLSEK